MSTTADDARNDRGAHQPSGFPSPAADSLEADLNLHDLVVTHPTATFYFEMTTQSMRGVGILEHDILVVDRSLTPIAGAIVLAAVDGEFVVRIYRPQPDGVLLASAHPAYPPLRITAEMSCVVWGVVTAAVHRL